MKTLCKLLEIRKKTNNYEITISNNDVISKYSVSEDFLIDNNIYKNNISLNCDEYELFLLNVKSDEFYCKCLRKIKTKIRSKNEIILFLENNKIENKFIDVIINKLTSLNLLNDSKYANQYTLYAMNALKGPRKIREHLFMHKVAQEYIEDALLQYTDELINDNLNSIIVKNLKLNSKDSFIKFRDKLIKKLMYQGYFIEDITKSIDFNEHLLRNSLNEEENLKIHVEKLRVKFKTKQNSEKLVIKSLLNKGFKYNDIKKTM